MKFHVSACCEYREINQSADVFVKYGAKDVGTMLATFVHGNKLGIVRGSL